MPAAAAADPLSERRRLARAGCERWLVGHGDPSPQATLAAIAAEAREEQYDRYGEDGEVAALEREVCELLGKEAAVFMPSGVMAQQAILRAWVEQTGRRAVGVHGLSHLVVHELQALTELHGMRLQHLADDRRPVTAADVKAFAEPLAAVAIELPLRDAGYLLPAWEELVAVSEACRERQVALHVDGARLWESQPWLSRSAGGDGVSLAQIAALADTIYVSFYKGLGGLAGAVVAGPASLVASARRWQRRHGGTLFSLLPYAVAARAGLRQHLPRMTEYHDTAVALAAAVAGRSGLRVLPDPPQTVAFRLFAPAGAEDLNEAAIEVMETARVGVPAMWRPTEVPGWSMTEVTVGSATVDLGVDAAADLLVRIAEMACEATTAAAAGRAG
ncbi:MAG: threonine aldolase family protein [Actinomycetales bacterium]